MKIKKADANDFATIRAIAYASWPVAYGDILSNEQLQWMLSKFYSDENLQKNLYENQQFYIVYDDKNAVGFVGIEHHYKKLAITRLHKLYINPEAQGSGIGRFLIDFVTNQTQESNCLKISLNVNKFNKAVEFYRKLNFQIVGEEIIPIGNEYVMDDFQMEKVIMSNV